jgi:hypothetical protein
MSSLTQDERKQYMDTLKLFMIEDLDKAIKAGLNYLAALGLSTYTEILGGLCYGNRLSNHKQNYDRFIRNYFPTPYQNTNKQLNKFGGLYGVVRSGLTHRYLIQQKSQVATTSSISIDCGIFYDPNHTPPIIFVLDQYFEDFKIAVNEYYNKLIIDRDSHLVMNFDKAVIRAKLSDTR